MPSTIHRPGSDQAPLSPLRRSRNASASEHPWDAGAVDGGGGQVAGTVLVAFDGGPAGRAALGFALRGTTGPLAVAHVWAPVDPLGLLRECPPQDTATLLRELGRDDQRARDEAARIAAVGVALAQEAGRAATPVLVAAPDGMRALEALAAWAGRERAAHLVVCAPARTRWRRRLGADPAQRLLEAAPCPVTVVPAELAGAWTSDHAPAVRAGAHHEGAAR